MTDVAGWTGCCGRYYTARLPIRRVHRGIEDIFITMLCCRGAVFQHQSRDGSRWAVGV